MTEQEAQLEHSRRLYLDLNKRFAALRKEHSEACDTISTLRKQYEELEWNYYGLLQRRQEMLEERELLLDKLENAQGDLRYIIEGVR